jgi:hypothetical protein
VISLLLFGLSASAQISFTVMPDRTKIAKSEALQITATLVANKNLGNIPVPAVPASDAYDVVKVNRNQSQSSSIQIINGRASQSVEITYLFYYTIAPKKEGSFTFPALQVAIDGKAFASQPFPVMVTSEPVSNPDVVVLLSMAKKDLYAGEQSLITIKIGQKPNSPAQLGNEGFSAFVQAFEKALSKNFSCIMLSKGRAIRGAEIMNGEQYIVFKVPYAVFPLTAGAFSIPSIPFEYQMLKRVQRRSVDPFDDFFGGGFFGQSVEATPRTAASNSVSGVIKALPPAPADFAGAVGRFSLAASMDPQNLATGDATTLKISIAGNTRPGGMGDIKLAPLKDIEIFTPEKNTSVDTTDNGLSSRKTYKYLMIPHAEGAVAVPGVAFTYFDPATGSYQTARSGDFSLQVTKGKEGAKPQTRYLTQEDIREVGKDIRYIKTPAHLVSQIEKPYRRPIFYLLYPLPFLISLFCLLFRLQAEHKDRNPALILKRKAYRTATAQLKRIRKKMPAF